MRDVLATEMKPVRVLKGKAQGVKMSPQWKSTKVLLHLKQILLSFCAVGVGKMTGSAFMLTNFDGVALILCVHSRDSVVCLLCKTSEVCH